MNRGSKSIQRNGPTTSSTFNEAPIHESGKFIDPSPSASGLAPSMRPRFMNRGSQRWSWLGRRCETAFNEAPIHESGKFQQFNDSVSWFSILQ